MNAEENRPGEKILFSIFSAPFTAPLALGGSEQKFATSQPGWLYGDSGESAQLRNSPFGFLGKSAKPFRPPVTLVTRACRHLF